MRDTFASMQSLGRHKVLSIYVLSVSFFLSNHAQAAPTIGAIGEHKPCEFVCVQPRSAMPFVVRAKFNTPDELEDLVIKRIETKKGRVTKMIWEEDAGDVDLDMRYQATASQWKTAMPFRVQDEGEVQEAILYVPTQMSAPDAPSILRTRMKIKLKQGGDLDLRLQCARTMDS
jgi:hypothetical protein